MKSAAEPVVVRFTVGRARSLVTSFLLGVGDLAEAECPKRKGTIR
jgi:hypothetical protein